MPGRQVDDSRYRLFARDAVGVLRHNGIYLCSGCQMNFTGTSEWRGDEGEVDLAYVRELHLAATPTRSGLPPA